MMYIKLPNYRWISQIKYNTQYLLNFNMIIWYEFILILMTLETDIWWQESLVIVTHPAFNKILVEREVHELVELMKLIKTFYNIKWKWIQWSNSLAISNSVFISNFIATWDIKNFAINVVNPKVGKKYVTIETHIYHSRMTNLLWLFARTK